MHLPTGESFCHPLTTHLTLSLIPSLPRVDNLKVIVPCAFLSAITLFAWIATKSPASLIVVSILYPFFSDGLMALPPAVIVSLTPALNQIGTRVGMAFSFGSLGVLLGSPIAGAILGSQRPRHGSSNIIIGQETF